MKVSYVHKGWHCLGYAIRLFGSLPLAYKTPVSCKSLKQLEKIVSDRRGF